MKIKLRLSVFLFLIQNFAIAQSQLDTLQLLQDVKTLSADSMQGRKSCTAGSQKAQRYILAAFKENNLRSFNGSYKQIFSFSMRGEKCDSATNLIGYFPGTTSSDCLVLSAHYDHLGVINGQIYPGADDNASGVAALLAIMDYFSRHQSRHTLLFAVFDGEEAGLLGARAFVNNLPLDAKKIALNINLDMVSRNEKNELYAAGASHYPFLKPYLEKIVGISTIKLRFGHDRGWGADNWTNSSDHAAFHQLGIPFVYFGVEDHRDYHRPTDVFVGINPKFFINAAATILAAVLAFDGHLEEIANAKNPASGN